jgi:hypothetical protein
MICDRAPETQGVVASLIGALPRQNVTEIANLITMIATGCYRVVSWDLELFGTLENYVINAQASFCDWILEGQLFFYHIRHLLLLTERLLLYTLILSR